ncbi:MAG TPA: amidohydrolase family protein, partial [Candidatus Acidoferrum sp.]|nr:amidohydrolase family protein [Candidatus Acidoferrum sp.]
IESVGSASDKSDFLIDAHGSVVMPGLINMHTHVGMTSLRGMVDCSSLKVFLEQTSEFDRHNTKEMIKKSTELAAEEMISSGTTSFLDLYYSEDVIAAVASKAGLRSFLSWVVLDKEYTTQKGTPIRNAESFVKRYKGKGPVTPSFGLQGVYVCSKETIRNTIALAEKYNTLVHMHLSETKEEVSGCVEKNKLRPIEFMHKNRFLSKRTIAAHCVWANNDEMGALSKSHATAVNNAISNARLGSGTADIRKMLGKRINVALGTDSAASNDSLDMFQTMKFSALVNGLTAQQALDMATVNAAMALQSEIGSIEKGKLADIIILDGAAIKPTNKKNAVSNVVFAAHGRNVTTSIIGGKIVRQK